MGRPPKPNELKQRMGTLQPCRTKAAVAVLPSDGKGPPMPKGLESAGKRAWRSYWALGNSWLSPRTDLQIITRLCRAYDEEIALRLDVELHGHVIESERNGLIANPAVSQLRKLEEIITRYEGLCGFTPSDRSRLGMAEVQRVSKLDSFLTRQREGQTG